MSPPVVRLDAEEPMMPLRGTVKAYDIRDASQLGPGLLADGFLGDLVLENDLVRFVVRRPDPALPVMPPAGAIIDISNQKSRADYFNYYEPLADVESTSTRVKMDRVVSFLVDRQTTARLVMEGRVVQTLLPDGVSQEDAGTTQAVEKVLPIKVTTTYELAKNVPYLVLRTRFTSEGPNPLTLAPGDYIDWGEATTFVEGAGIGSADLTTALWTGAFIDDFSAAVCTPGEKPLTVIASTRYTIVSALEGAARRRAALATPTKTPPAAASVSAPAFVPVPASLSPAGGARTVPPAPSMPPPRETHYGAPPSLRPTAAIHPLPERETQYGPHALLGRPETGPVSQPSTIELHRESLGGGTERNPDAGGGPLPSSANTKTQAQGQGRVVLPAGGSYEFTRYIIVGDRNLSRCSEQAYKLKGIPLGVIGGVVVEQGTGQPIPFAEVRISGGPRWDGKAAPYAFTKALTRADGSFVVRLPYGNYVATAAKIGREMTAPPHQVSLYRNSVEQYFGLILSKEARLLVAVSDPEAPTSAPLPSRLMLVAKGGTEPVDWGYGPGSTAGVRNIAYMPNGAASVPVTPGAYRLYISRGPEYDAVVQDVVVTRGSSQKIIVTLPRAYRSQGMISADLGVMTTSSATALVTPTDLAVMAACEGVGVLVTGDFDHATDITGDIQRLGLQQYVKCIPGMRFLVSGRGATANVLVYPVTGDTAEKLRALRAKNASVAPDVFLADLRKQFPNLVIQIDQPMHPLSGYLAPIPFNDRFKRYDEANVPPPDFHALQVLNGKLLGEFYDVLARYFDLEIKRTRSSEPAPALTPLGSSMCRLPYGTEVGYPRVYALTLHDTLETFTPGDLAQAILNQHVIVTNSLMPKLLGYAPSARTYAAGPGDVVDTGTTGALPMKINVMASSWVSLSNFDLTWNGKTARRIQVMPVKKVLRYPVRQQPDADVQYVYVDGDGFANLICFSNRAPLSPIVPPAPPDFGGDVFPLAWTGPIFVDQNRDGRIRIEDKETTHTAGQGGSPSAGP
jgi:hypothetical protein